MKLLKRIPLPSVFFCNFFIAGLCFWKDDKIRHCISHSIALLMLQPVIRDSDG